MKIIRAGLDQLPQVVALFDAYRQFYRQPANLAGAREFLRARIEKEESVIFLAVSETDAMQGVGFVQLYPSFSSVSMKRLWVLNDLFVHPDARKQGVGELLLERARHLAVETQAAGLMLETETSNTAAQALYEKLGWKKSLEYFVYYKTP